ncbi:MAG: hypothetical protein MJZ11_04935 [Lachnospiraceae bacterium]|nr:hypothetical protein [Lachnospiraceae bacterium]
MQLNNSAFNKNTAKIKKNVICILLSFIILIPGCGDKSISVADDILAKDGNEASFIEIDKFEVKTSDGTLREEVGSCAILIPEEFEESKEVKGMYVSNIYPLDASNIYYTVSDSKTDGRIDETLTSAQYEAAIESSYKYMNKSVDLVIDNFEKTELDNVPCFKIRSHFTSGDLTVQQLTYIIISTKTHVITYTQASDDELLLDFRVDEGNIKLVREISQA